MFKFVVLVMFGLYRREEYSVGAYHGDYHCVCTVRTWLVKISQSQASQPVYYIT